MELCLFSSALPGWDAARVARAALDAGLSAVEWGIGPGQAVGGLNAQKINIALIGNVTSKITTAGQR